MKEKKHQSDHEAHIIDHHRGPVVIIKIIGTSSSLAGQSSDQSITGVVNTFVNIESLYQSLRRFGAVT
jgi:hypothetical protein